MYGWGRRIPRLLICRLTHTLLGCAPLLCGLSPSWQPIAVPLSWAQTCSWAKPSHLVLTSCEHHEPSMSTVQYSIFALTCASPGSPRQRQPHHSCWRMESGCHPWVYSSPHPPWATSQSPSPVDFVTMTHLSGLHHLLRRWLTAHFDISRLLGFAFPTQQGPQNSWSLSTPSTLFFLLPWWHLNVSNTKLLLFYWLPLAFVHAIPSSCSSFPELSSFPS